MLELCRLRQKFLPLKEYIEEEADERRRVSGNERLPGRRMERTRLDGVCYILMRRDGV